ncbi:MAG TPA: PASTA domain-containing protein, partial [Mycobacterium sp.]|nr:PASTA domain-containing protein [Mycobacterium sp.]
VISTEPEANSTARKGDIISVKGSYGPEQRQIPDVASLSYEAAVTKLRDKGFSKFKRAESPSTPELKDRVVGTNPPVNSTSAITNEITVLVGTGPEVKEIPDVTGQTPDEAQKTLTLSGFTKVNPVSVDSPRPAGEVLGTRPAARETVPVDTVIELRVSKGNQFVMPDLRGMVWTDAEPLLRALGWTGMLIKGPDVDAGGDSRNRVVAQSPGSGQGANIDGNVTLTFGR